MHLDRRISTTIIFFGATLTLVIYLLAMRYLENIPAPIFFISIALIAGSLLYQILGIELSPGFAGLVLLEITAASVVFHLIYQIPTHGFYGSDAYYDMASLKAIMESGHIGGVIEYVQITSFFPMIHILGAALSQVSGIEPFSVAKWFPPLIGTITIPLIYLLVRQIFKQEKAALLAALLYGSMQHYVNFGSLFVRETIAIVLALSCIYLYVTAKSSGHPFAYRTLAIVCLVGTVLAHHLTSVMLISLLAFYWVFTVMSRMHGPWKWLLKNTTGEGVSLSLLIIALVGTFAYWIITVTEPMQLLTTFIGNVFTPSTWGLRTILQQEMAGVPPNLRYYFLIYGSYISYVIFGLILLYKSLSRADERPIETPVFTSYLIMCGIIGVMSFYLLPATLGGDRFLAFGWLFAFGPLALAIVEFRHKLMFSFSILVTLFFIFVNLYTIHPTLWNPEAEGAGGAAHPDDFALAETIDFSQGNILGYQNSVTTIYDVQNKMGTDAFFQLDPINLKDFQWVIINRDSLKEEGLYSEYTREVISEFERLEAKESPAYCKIYESNNLSVLQHR